MICWAVSHIHAGIVATVPDDDVFTTCIATTGSASVYREYQDRVLAGKSRSAKYEKCAFGCTDGRVVLANFVKQKDVSNTHGIFKGGDYGSVNSVTIPYCK